MSNCIQCGTPMEETRGSVPYDALPGTVLVGVELAECPNCGETEVGIPRIAELDRTLAKMVVEQKSRLTPDEIKFLRKFLGLSGKDLAARMGVSPETVSRWENDRQPMSEPNERLLRAIAAHETPIDDYGEALPNHELRDPQPWEARLSADDHWREKSPAA